MASVLVGAAMLVMLLFLLLLLLALLASGSARLVGPLLGAHEGGVGAPLRQEIRQLQTCAKMSMGTQIHISFLELNNLNWKKIIWFGLKKGKNKQPLK
jgi:hypothetical protein